MSPETAEAIEITYRVVTGLLILFALAIFVWTVMIEIHDREKRERDDLLR